MGTITAATAAFGIAAVLSLGVWKLARGMFAPSRIVVFAIAAALGWMILFRAWALPTTSYSEAVQRLAAAGVGTAWFVLIKDAARAAREREKD